MSEPAEIAVRTQRFDEAVRDFKLPSPSRHAKLMPLKDDIVELRQKAASLRLIRELLATVDVAVGTDTIARFLAEVNASNRRADHRNDLAADVRPFWFPQLRRPSLCRHGSQHLQSQPQHRTPMRHPNDHAFAVRVSQIPTTSDSTQLLMNKQINLIINGKGDARGRELQPVSAESRTR
jgi:hypothetical protein